MKPTKKQQEIFDTATKLFVQKGYAETSVRDIAAVLDIKAASLYSHINSKEEILNFICDDVFDRFNNELLKLKESDIPYSERFPEFIRIYITESLRNIDGFVLFQKYWKLSDKNVEKYADGQKLMVDRLHKLLENALPGDVQEDCFIENSTVYLILHILKAIPHYVKDKENPDIEAVVKEIQKRLHYGYAN